jgi:hypothetical protein
MSARRTARQQRAPDPLEEALEEHAADLAAALQHLIDPERRRPPSHRRHWWQITTWKEPPPR